MTNPFVVVGLILGIVALPFLGLFLYSVIHYALDRYFHFPFALAYCRKHGRTPLKWRCTPAFYNGVKTEFMIVEVLRSGDSDNKHLVRFLVWVFGVKKVLDWNVPLEKAKTEV